MSHASSSSTSSGDGTLFGLVPGTKAFNLHKEVKEFLEKEILPMEGAFVAHAKSDQRWTPFSAMEDLKTKAQAKGLWNLFLPRESDPSLKYGAGLNSVEYAHMAELMGRVPWASEVFNCSAPDTGNMEVLVRYGTEAQKQQWLIPLLQGKIRSCFAMTEPEAASSDATNLKATITRKV
jgi:acyl-CoA dehydrogenase family protein 10